MSETAGTIIKLLSALTSPKASVKYISVGLFLLLSWKYLDSILMDLGAPKDHHSLILLLIGLGVGSLIGQLIYTVISYVWIKIEKYSAENKEQERRRRIKEQEIKLQEKKDGDFLELFRKAYKHFPYWKRDALRNLLSQEQRLESNLEYIHSLKQNSYIKKTVNIDRETDLYTINPIIADHVKEQWENEISENMKSFFEYMPPEHEELLKIMESSDEEYEGPVSKGLVDYIKPLHYCFEIEEDDDGFHISFRKPYFDLFEKETAKKFVNSVYIENSWVVNT